MKIFFLLKEGLAGFQRARLASAVTITSICLSLALVGVFAIMASNLYGYFQHLYQQIHLEVFVDPSLNEEEIHRLEAEIRRLPLVESVTYISPREALQNFQRDFGGDLVSLLEENPLPPSLQVILAAGYRQIDQIDALVDKVKSLPAVDDVLYQEKLARLINRYFLVAVVGVLGLGATIFFVSTLLIFNTIRLTIHSRQSIIEIMRLVGATDRFVKAPFMIEGILQGLIGGLLAAVLIWLGADLVRSSGLIADLIVPSGYFVFLLLTGVLLGFVGSYISVGKYIKL